MHWYFLHFRIFYEKILTKNLSTKSFSEVRCPTQSMKYFDDVQNLKLFHSKMHGCLYHVLLDIGSKSSNVHDGTQNQFFKLSLLIKQHFLSLNIKKNCHGLLRL